MDKTGGSTKVDERIIMFSRAELEPGTDRFIQFYSDHPEYLTPDDHFRSLPGLLKPGSLFYNPFVFSAAEATFETVSALHSKIDGPVSEVRVEADPEKFTDFIINWCKSIGAHSVGITQLQPEHLYSIGGRGNNYGEPIINDHQYAIAVTVTMDYSRVRMAPRGPITMESSAQYLHAGNIAVMLAGWIRNLGYPARAHIDGNYQVRCPQVARDAGLGQIGRLSLLVTPGLGPRVRIAVVTTDIPLNVSVIAADSSVLEFCRICRKCADNCPAAALSFAGNPEPDMDWNMNQSACYNYWCKAGTDCGRCIAVCPYSHRRNIIHNSVRFLVRKSGLFRRLAVLLDDWFYGRRPGIHKMEEWMQK